MRLTCVSYTMYMERMRAPADPYPIMVHLFWGMNIIRMPASMKITRTPQSMPGKKAMTITLPLQALVKYMVPVLSLKLLALVNDVVPDLSP